MGVNRLKRYFDEIESEQGLAIALRSAASFERLVEASATEFSACLQEVIADIQFDAKTHQSPIRELMALILSPCFLDTAPENSLFQVEFVGDDARAHRVLCVAAVIFVNGWQHLTPEARKWSRDLLICAVPRNLSKAGLYDFASAKTLIGSMMSGLSFATARPAPSNLSDTAQGYPGLVDPFIGL